MTTEKECSFCRVHINAAIVMWLFLYDFYFISQLIMEIVNNPSQDIQCDRLISSFKTNMLRKHTDEAICDIFFS